MEQSIDDDIRHALGELGQEALESGDYDRVVSRGRALRRQRTAALGGVVAILGVVAGIWFVVSGTTDPATPPKRVVAGAECKVVNDGVPVFPQFHEDTAPRGASGDVIIVEGTGFYAPASSVEVLWNKDVPGLPNLDQDRGQGPGSTMRLASGDLVNHCAFNVTFTVPDVSAGDYPVSIRIYDPDSDYSITSEFSFSVTA